MQLIPSKKGGNIWEWLWFYAATLYPSPYQPVLSTSWANEIVPPWRQGRGIAIKMRRKLCTIGFWKKAAPPDEEPAVLTYDASEIGTWHKETGDS